MKIYTIWQEINNNYDTYDSAIVYAENEEEAKRIHPNPYYKFDEEGDEYWTKNEGYKQVSNSWCALKDVKAKYLGENKDVKEKGLIIASFNAG